MPANLVITGTSTAEATDLSEKPFLLSHPRGAYTTARTVNTVSVFEFSFHIQRLCESVRLMLEDNAKKCELQNSTTDGPISDDDIRSLINKDKMHNLIKSSLSFGLTRFRELHPELNNLGGPGRRDSLHAHVGECKLTLLLTWGDNACESGGPFTLYTHIARLPPVPAPPVKVHAFGKPRLNPHAKDSQWVKDRAELEKQKPEDVNEVLLIDENGNVEEGMSSNFFAVHKGTVYTAEEGVLKGTVRELVLECCKRLNIPVILEPPRINAAHEWDSAFITSTSRLVLPIDELTVQATGHMYQLPDHSVTYRLREQVLKDIVAASEPVL